ncbi:putative Ubiquitin-like domain-containing protein [Seiridium unicorne]|uniref:Ubiquitin-like domain-containing protein n=1 Tax=Seiridium unicorne TaxID=138068 RepID=A0ABR2UJF5_9PEZI
MTTLKPPPLATSSAPPLSLTIRFSASVPDLDLDIPHPSQTTVISLKNLIRSRLAEPNSQRRLRFIQGGKILPDTAALSSVLRAPPPPPRADDDGDAKGKGKGVANRHPLQRIYVNCSIGDSLTDAELKAEAEAASVPVSDTAPSPSRSARSPLPPGTPALNTGSSATPRGFDRLINTGFSAAEVNQLRLQFRSIHSSQFTPDTLPSPDSFRRMEDAWIDDNGAMPTTGGGVGASMGGGFESDEVGLLGWLDAMIWGVTVGFLWPLGSAGWLAREHGIHSDRLKVMIGAGLFLSLLIGIVRMISGEK